MKVAEVETKTWEGTRAIEATQARQAFREVIDEAYAAGRRVVILRHGRAVAALVAIKDLLRLREHDRAADLRLIERAQARDGAVRDAVPIEGLVAALEQAEAGNLQGEGEDWSYGDVPIEQLAGDIVNQYIESPEFLQLARVQVKQLIATLVEGQENFSAVDATHLKSQIVASLVQHGLSTHQFA
ncbi:type II toxin-antitoxin system Phd/YefM family antitoxin [Sphingomonas sp. MMS12-HWE2-04]|uniref:type II toxin-antitoxin system Phd/YefM family antitoxin n=1 Tax=Sphingomonas sp. MMS12-HWE2-04 TaxID=3234199 RepID=UPI00384B0B9D